VVANVSEEHYASIFRASAAITFLRNQGLYLSEEIVNTVTCIRFPWLNNVGAVVTMA
jgi:hypothetical protein